MTPASLPPSQVFVTGATGTTGSATVSALRAAGVDVIAGVHSLEKSGPLRKLGAVIKPLNYADVEGMTAAMRGADRLFLVTPVTEQTQKLTASIVEAAEAAGIVHIVKLSGLDVDSKPGFTLGHWHRAAEQVIEASGVDWTFLRPNAFMQNFLGSAESIRSQGTYHSPFGATPVNFVDARDIGEAAAIVLSSEGHAGKIYLAYPLKRSKRTLTKWSIPALAATFRSPWASSRPGFAPMRTALTTSLGCAGRTVSSARSATARAAGGQPRASSSAGATPARLSRRARSSTARGHR